MISVVFAAAGLGLLTGLLLGLSVTSIVGTVASALTAVLVAFVGLRSAPASPPAGNSAPEPLAASDRSVRIGVFSFAVIISLFLALYMRAHDPIGPPVKTQIDDLTQAGYTKLDACALVAYREFGLVGKGWAAPTDSKPIGAPVLFKVNTSMCAELDPTTFQDSIVKTLNAWVELGRGKWAKLAKFVETRIPESEQLDAIKVLHSFACE